MNREQSEEKMRLQNEIRSKEEIISHMKSEKDQLYIEV